MDLKGTQSEKNLRAALLGESLARNKYTYFADKARKEGDEDLAKLFERMALNESVHARIWYTTLYGEIKGGVDALKDAASGEFDEWSNMYPSFAKQAREDGFEELAKAFESIARIEKNHEKQFMEAMVQHRKGKEQASAPEPALEKPLQKKMGYRCMFCGATFEDRPDACPVCQAIGSYDACEIWV